MLNLKLYTPPKEKVWVLTVDIYNPGSKLMAVMLHYILRIHNPHSNCNISS